MKKYTKKLLALAMVLAMVLSLGVSAYALTDPGYYVQNPVTSNPSQALTITGTATVYLSIVSDRIYDSNDDYVQIERYNMPVSIGTSGVTSVYNVSDVLVAAANQYSGLSFTVANGGTFTSSSTYLYGVKDTAVSNQVFQPATYEDFFDAMDYYDDPY
ncbi:MAG: hypothetical protein IKR48_13635, partial [Kiritimatiellae bacterium]|nr:hypothetical protein [Kiritimatiellia bacterium]